MSDDFDKMWTGAMRKMAAGNPFAGLAKLKAFENGKTLTNSARSTFLNCRKKYEYSYVYGLASRKPSIPFLVGGLFHNELEEMYTNGVFDEDSAKVRIEKACEKASQQEGLTPEDSDNIWTQKAVVLGMVRGYAKFYLKEDLKRWEIIRCEGDFSVALPGGWVYRGKTDMVIREKATKKRFLVEHKTAGVLGASYIAKLPLDNQIIGYAWADRELGNEYDGVLYNVAKKPSIRLKGNESMSQFLKRVEDEYVLWPAKYFYREPLAFSNASLDRFGEELKRFVKNIDRAHEEKDFYQNTTQCTAMGVCPFMRLCVEGVDKDTLMMYRVKSRAHEELPPEDGE